MSFETSELQAPVLDEAMRIKDVLLTAREDIETAHTRIEDSILQGARVRLGYSEFEPGDMSELVDARVTKQPMVTPRMVTGVLPLSNRSALTTLEARKTLADIHAHRNFKLAVGIGECSVRDPEATLEYTRNVVRWQPMFPNLLLMQRAFLEKPRTPKKIGGEMPWKGFIYDPLLDGSNDINLGVIASRLLLCRITDMGVPTLKEQLNALTPQFLNGLVTQDNIGARSVEDQKGMEYASGTSAVVGEKNNLEGDIEVAMQAAASAHGEHAFLGIDDYGNICLVRTTGNDTAHVILRGGKNGPNYEAEHVEEARQLAEKYGLEFSLDIDANHGNSGKKAKNQLIVVRNVASQIEAGEPAITGVQMETNLVEGKQPFEVGMDLSLLVYGQSITDECMGIPDTLESLSILDEAAAKRRERANVIGIT